MVVNIGLVTVLIILAASGGGLLGLPLSIPPLPPDPVIARAAPDDCLLHLALEGVAAPDSGSANLTERMLADDEVREFLAALGREALKVRQMADLPPAIDAAATTLVTALFTRPAAITIERFAPPAPGRPPEIVASVLIRTGDREAALAEAADTLAALMPGIPVDQPAAKVTLGTARLWRMPTPLGPFSWGVHEGSLIAAIGAEAAESLLERIADQGRPAPAWKTAARDRMAVARPATLAYLDAAAVVRLMKAGPASGDDRLEAILDASGLEDLASLVAATGMDREGVVTDLRLAFQGPPTGLFAPGGESVGAEQLARVPADAVVAQAWLLDLARLLVTTLDVIDAADPTAAAGIRSGLERFRAVVGFDLEEHLLRPLGPDWTVVALPAPGALLPNLAVMAGLEDRETFATTHKALLDLLRKLTGDDRSRPTITEIPYRGQTIYMLAVEGPDLALPFSPAWCLTEDRLIVTLSPQLLKTLLARADGDPSLLDVPEVKRALAEHAEADLVGVLDPQPLLASLCSLYELASPYVRQAAAGSGLDVTLPTLPRMTSLMPSARPSVTVIRHEPEAIRVRTTTTLPLGPLGGGGGAILGLSPAATPVMISLLVPAVQSAREAARRAQTMNNMKQVLLAMHNYHDAHGRFPSQAICDAQGKPLLSWRVALLPYFGAQNLYDEFRLDEPWDSPHNRPLVDRMPTVWADPSADPAANRAGLTTLQVITGTGTPFATPEEGPGFRDILDGSSKTLAILRVMPNKAVPWTKPEDHPFDPDEPLAGFGQPDPRSGGVLGGFFDGSVRGLPLDIDAELFRAYVTPAGGETIEVP